MTTNMATLETLLEREIAERDAALAALQQAQQRAAATREQAEQLAAYRVEYQQRWAAQFSRRVTIEILRCYQEFGQRLGEAIHQQQHVADHAQTQLQRARETLTAQEIRCASVRKLIERRVQEINRAADLREQKQTDESAQRAAWGRRGALA